MYWTEIRRAILLRFLNVQHMKRSNIGGRWTGFITSKRICIFIGRKSSDKWSLAAPQHKCFAASHVLDWNKARYSDTASEGRILNLPFPFKEGKHVLSLLSDFVFPIKFARIALCFHDECALTTPVTTLPIKLIGCAQSIGFGIPYKSESATSFFHLSEHSENQSALRGYTSH